MADGLTDVFAGAGARMTLFGAAVAIAARYVARKMVERILTV